MSDDLVTRLKGLADCDSRAGEPLGKCMREAAARIEADAATIARLTAERDSVIDKYAAAVDARMADIDRWIAAEAKLAALVEAAQGMSTPIKNVDFETRLEQHGRLFAAVTAAKGAK